MVGKDEINRLDIIFGVTTEPRYSAHAFLGPDQFDPKETAKSMHNFLSSKVRVEVQVEEEGESNVDQQE